MKDGSRFPWAYLSAGILALLTLGVFYVLQDYGPESAIRKFHVAAAAGDAGALQSVTQQPVRTQEVQILAAKVRRLLGEGYRYQVLRMDRSPTQVRAAVVYTVGNIELPEIWVVEKDGRSWKIDAFTTEGIQRDSLGFSFGNP